MPESRDRRTRSEDIATLFSRRRQAVRETGVLPDDERFETTLSLTTPRRTMTRTPTAMRRAVRGSGLMRGNNGGFGRGSRFGSPRIGQENTPVSLAAAASGRRGRNSVLPSWYPRTPLRDVTAVVRAIERRRDSTTEAERQQMAVAQLEHDVSLITPAPAARANIFTPTNQVLKIFNEKANQINEESEFITPQKKLLNSIDTVSKVMMEELRKQKQTPAAKKAEREKKVRTLMSMR